MTHTPELEHQAPMKTNRIVELLDAHSDPALVGGKAWPLGRAHAAGQAVPAGFVVTPQADCSSDEVARWLEALGPGPYAVRSSAMNEDASAQSFAGQLETVLGVDPAGVDAAIQRCRASAEALRVLRYGGTPGEVAVIVQRMVDAELAGVAFSADPHTGERGAVIIEAVRGLGDRLVSGETDAESWQVCAGEATCTRRGDEDVLNHALAVRIAEMASAMEELFGGPQDVEWAYADGQLWLLQSRPITALPAAPIPIEVVVPKGSWERDDHHAVLSPLGWDWFQPYLPALGEAFSKYLPIKGMRGTRIGGHLYVQMEGGGGGTPPTWVLWLVTRLMPSMRRADRECVDLIDGESFVAEIDAWDKVDRAAVAAATDGLFDPDPGQLSDEALLARIQETLAHSARCLERHARLSIPAMVGLGKLMLFIEDELGWDQLLAFTLVTGSSGATTELNHQIEGIVADHAAELGDGEFPSTWGELVHRAPAMGSALVEWLSANQLRMLHYEPKHPSLGERPDLVLAIAHAAYDERHSDGLESAADRAEQLCQDARSKLTPERYGEFERLVDLARRGYALRDENGIETVSRPSGLVRWYVRELGRRLPLEVPEHAVYLSVDEHAPALAGQIGDDELRARVTRRRGEESWAVRNRGPAHHGKAPDPMPPVAGFPPGLAKLIRIFGGLEHAEALPENTDGSMRGIGIGDRVVTAKARVIGHPDELGSLGSGEVLVCRITSPEWSVALGRVAAIVTNEGALLSHPAIIAREYGVTAVVGCGPATDLIQTGDIVRVDPIDGTVAVIKDRQHG